MNKTGCDNLLILPDTEPKIENSTQTICLIYLIYFWKCVHISKFDSSNTLQTSWDRGNQKSGEVVEYRKKEHLLHLTGKQQTC